MQENEAIARLKSGDIRGLETLVKLYQVQALQAAYLTTGDYPLSEDIVQAAFLRAYNYIHRFDTTRPFGPWFLRTVVNSALTAVSSRREVSLEANLNETGELLDLPNLDRSVEELLDAAETRDEVLSALEKLPPAQRAAVVMHYYLDLSNSEMARQLNIPPGTVRRRLHDARQRLRSLLPT